MRLPPLKKQHVIHIPRREGHPLHTGPAGKWWVVQVIAGAKRQGGVSIPWGFRGKEEVGRKVGLGLARLTDVRTVS